MAQSSKLQDISSLQSLCVLLLLLMPFPILAQSPGGVSGYETWLVTSPVGNDLNGSYHWVDFSGDSASVLTSGGAMYTLPRDSVQTFNFHPAMSLRPTSGPLAARLRQTLSSRCTVIGVFAPRFAFVPSDMTLYTLAGDDTTAVSRTWVSHSGGGALTFDGHWLTDPARSPRVLTWERAASPPDRTVWGSATGVTLYPGGVSPFPVGAPGFDGWCPELLVYGRVLSPLERRQAESYLALKYGLTLEGSYWLGDRVVWNLSGGDTLRRVTGIVNGGPSGFRQSFSTTSYEDSARFSLLPANDSFYARDSYGGASIHRLLVMGRHLSTDIPDGGYMLWGDDNGVFTGTVNVGGGWHAMPRRWVVSTDMDTLSAQPLSLTCGNAAATADGSLLDLRGEASGDGWVRIGPQTPALHLAFTCPADGKAFDAGIVFNESDEVVYGYRFKASGAVHRIINGAERPLSIISNAKGHDMEIYRRGDDLCLRTSQRRTISRPTMVTVKDGSGALLRKTTATYTSGKNAAKAATVTRTISETPSVTSVTSYSYNSNTGNLETLSHASESGNLIYTYQYGNGFLQTYPNKITAPHNLSTDIEGMSLAYGLPTQQKDPNNKVLSTIYDGLGRLLSVKSPNENTPYQSTVDMSYTPMAVMRADGQGIQTPAHAVATHHLRQPYVTSQGHFTHDDSMRVVTFVDGFGEVLQTRRESVIDNGSGGQCRKVIVDGCKAYDGLGRAVRAFYPAEADSANLMVWQPTAQAGEQGIVTEYDVLDRPVTVTTPDTTVTRYCYDVSGGCLRTAVTDPLGHRSETYADASGRTVRTVMYRDSAATQPIETRYVYDPVGRLTTVIDAGGDSTLITYDMLDRRTEVRHPASGTTRWTYDRLGNVLTEENETLRAQGDAIRYTWDIDRLTEEVCQGDTVRLFYGDANSSELTNGRLRFRLDRSGGTEYQYDNMGNVSFERRTVIVPGKGHATFETSWEYDSYGKLLRMTYPGDEAVIYLYNSTGDLRRVYAGNEDGGNDYVSSISYDRFGDRVRMTHGNGATMQYGYNPRTRRLSSLYLTTDRFMELSKAYAYDKAGNIVRSEGFLNSQLIHSYDYSYDALGRLSSATQYCLDGPSWAKDTLSMSYDDLWRITSKSQHVSGDGIMSPQPLYAGYDMTYTYGTEPGRRFRMDRVAETHYRTEGTPTAADRIRSTHHYSYDPNGNLVYMATDRTRSDGGATPKISERKLLWDARNRLRALSDDGYVSLYWYDADGNRTVKEHHGGEAVWVNSAPAGQRTDSVVYSVYPNPYINVNGDHWTKHYYIGGERVASRTGTLSGGFDDLHIPGNNPASAGTGVTLDYSAMRRAEEDSVVSVYERLGVPYEPQRVGTRGEGGHLYIPITQDEENACDIGAETAETPEGSPQRSHPNTLGEGQVYYYHRDHLGSTQSVTDGDGDFTQMVEYTPWGEVFVELKGDSVLTTPYLFNGKELDEETGLYYYGARYYDPKMSVWYSVDRFAEKYPYVSPYNYGVNNPYGFLDVNGDTVFWANNHNSMKVKERVDNLRKLSSGFNTLYNILDSSPNHYSVNVDDRIVQKSVKDQSGWTQIIAGGFTNGNTITFSENAQNSTFSEEFFHLFQNCFYRFNPRFPQELEAEAKLFDTFVLMEVDSPIFKGKQGVSNLINNINYLTPYSGAFFTILDYAKNTNFCILPGTIGFCEYKNYLYNFSFNHNNISGDPYAGPQRMLLPHAYNSIINRVK